mgnify:CR=1 FL=1
MALLSTSQLSKSFGADTVFSGVSFEIQKNDRVGLVGINGSGKTTLFKVLTGEYSADEGDIYKAKDCVTGYMEQHVCRDLHRSAYHEVLTVFSDLIELEQRLDTVNQALQGRPQNMQALLDEQFQLNDRFNREGGLTYKSRARSTLLGLGFTDEQMGSPIGVLSGGQKAKLQLAKMLLSGANLLLLDEPTNHLDIFMRETLTDALSAYTGTLLLVTHDRYLMQTLGCPILYLEDGKATFYQNFQKLHDRDTSKQPEPAKQEDKPQKAGYGKEQRRRRAEVRTRLKALETEIEELGAHIVELENEINDPEVLRDHLLLRDKCDELDDSRFHQQELYDEWEKLAEEQDRMDAESDS